MGFEIVEGWEQYPRGVNLNTVTGFPWTVNSSGGQISTTFARTGDTSYRMFSFAQRITNTFAAPISTVFRLGCALLSTGYTSTSPNAGIQIQCVDRSIEFTYTSGGFLQMELIGEGIQWTNGIATPTDTFIFIEFVLDPGARTWLLAIDGAQVASGTFPQTTGNINGLRLGNLGGSISAFNLYYDDVFVESNAAFALQGDREIRYIFPSADGTGQQWSFAGDPTAWESVGQVPNDIANTYIEAAAVNDISEFDAAASSTGVFAIDCVALKTAMRKETAGAGSVTPALQVSGNDYNGANQVLGTDVNYYTDFYDTNPDTASDWVPADIANLGMSFERTA